jgi:hypothetical protein
MTQIMYKRKEDTKQEKSLQVTWNLLINLIVHDVFNVNVYLILKAKEINIKFEFHEMYFLLTRFHRNVLEYRICLLLFRDTNCASTTTSSFRMLTTNSEAKMQNVL